MATALQAHDFFAVVRSTDRVGQVGQRNAHRHGVRLDPQLKLPFAGTRIVGDVKHTTVLSQFGLGFLDGRFELIHHRCVGQ